MQIKYLKELFTFANLITLLFNNIRTTPLISNHQPSTINHHTYQTYNKSLLILCNIIYNNDNNFHIYIIAIHTFTNTSEEKSIQSKFSPIRMMIV